MLIVIGIGLVFCICASFVWHSDNDQPIKRVPSQRADELPILPKTEDIQTYQDNVCKKCPYFDGYDMCLRREHWGSIIQNTVEYCKLRRNSERSDRLQNKAN